AADVYRAVQRDDAHHRAQESAWASATAAAPDAASAIRARGRAGRGAVHLDAVPALPAGRVPSGWPCVDRGLLEADALPDARDVHRRGPGSAARAVGGDGADSSVDTPDCARGLRRGRTA